MVADKSIHLEPSLPRTVASGTSLLPANRGRFFYLFVTQLLLIVLFPYLGKPGLPTVLMRLLSAASFLAAVYAVSERRAQRVTAIVLMIPTAALNILLVLRPELPIAVPTFVAGILFLSFTLVALLRAVLGAESVTSDTICGALSVYLLMAMLWGMAYMLLETVQPGSLSLDATRHPNHKIDWNDCMFYSFVTLTSTGYGDIVPVTAQSRSLSVLEAVGGIMYVAVLIARLVGVYSTARSEVKP